MENAEKTENANVISAIQDQIVLKKFALTNVIIMVIVSIIHAFALKISVVLTAVKKSALKFV